MRSFGEGELTEDDQVLGDGGVDNVHGTHGTTSVVEHPLLIVVDVGSNALALVQLVDNVLDNGLGIVAVGADGALLEIVKVLGVENVERLETLLKNVGDGSNQGEQDGEELEPAGDAATAAARRAGGSAGAGAGWLVAPGGGLLLGRHCDGFAIDETAQCQERRRRNRGKEKMGISNYYKRNKTMATTIPPPRQGVSAIPTSTTHGNP